MIRFLRLFPAFRVLQVEVADLRRSLKLQTRLRRAAESERDSLMLAQSDLRAQREEDQKQIAALIEARDAARQSEIEATRHVADYGFRLRFGRGVFSGQALELPAGYDPEQQKPVPKMRQQAADVVREKTRQFHEQAKANLEAHKRQAMGDSSLAATQPGQGQQAVDFFNSELQSLSGTSN